MAKPPQRESYRQRALRDTKSAIGSVRFRVVEAAVGASGAALAVTWLLWIGQTNSYLLALVPILGAFVLGVAGFLCLLLWQLVSAPHRLLSEAYEYLEALEMDDVGIAVRKLKKADFLEKFCAVKVYTGREEADFSSFGIKGIEKLRDIGLVLGGGSVGAVFHDDLQRKITSLGREAFRRVCTEGTAE